MPLNRIRFTEDVPIQDSKQHRWRDFDDKFRFYLQGVFLAVPPNFQYQNEEKNVLSQQADRNLSKKSHK